MSFRRSRKTLRHVQNRLAADERGSRGGKKVHSVSLGGILLWLWRIEWYQRDIIAADSKSLYDHYESEQSDERVFYLQQNEGKNKTERDKEKETKSSDEGMMRSRGD